MEQEKIAIDKSAIKLSKEEIIKRLEYNDELLSFIVDIIDKFNGIYEQSCRLTKSFNNRLAEERKVERNTKKNNYVFKCEHCGQYIRRERFSNFVQRYTHYTCGICGGKFQFIPEESNMSILTATGKLKMVANTGK